MATYFCILQSCKGRTMNSIHLFRFPKNRELCEKWCSNLKIDMKSLNTRSRLCSRHFESVIIGIGRRKMGAVPTLNLGHDDPNIYKSDIKEPPPRFKRCAVPGCKKTSLEISVFSFPSCEVRRQAFIEITGLVEKYHTQKFNICRLHFQECDVHPTKLKPCALPYYNVKYGPETETWKIVKMLVKNNCSC